MGRYIEVPQHKGKVMQILNIYGGRTVPFISMSQGMITFESIPDDMALICVVDNGLFEAAAWAYSKQEFEEFSRPDGRPKEWLLISRGAAIKATGFIPD